MEEQIMRKPNGYTVGSLFAGIGGICKGFDDAGFDLRWANEFDANACVTYLENFSEEKYPNHKLYSDDVHDLVKNKLNGLDKVDVVTSGFPCQAFSVAGYRKGFKDNRGNLFFETMKVINKIEPKAILLENVKNLVTHDDRKTFQVIKDTIIDSGYSFIPKVLNSMEYGNVPQTRERIYIVGFKGEAEFNKCSAGNICSENFQWPRKFKLQKKIQDILEKSRVDEKYYYNKNCHFYNDLKFGIKSRDTVYQWRRIYLRENKSNVCPTLTANMGTGGHNVPLVLDDYGIRKLTPRECARLQGFKEDFNIPYHKVCNSQLYKQIGNSVTVPVIKKVAHSINEALDLRYGRNSKISKKTEQLLECAF